MICLEVFTLQKNNFLIIVNRAHSLANLEIEYGVEQYKMHNEEVRAATVITF